MKGINVLILALLVVGGMNWGLVGLFSFDLVAATFGQMSALSRIVYALVGLAAAYRAFAWAVMKQDPAAGKAQLVC